MQHKHLFYIQIILFFFCICSYSYAQKKAKILIRQGNHAYLDSTYNEAEIFYRKALQEKPNDEIALYNLANTLHFQRNFKDSRNLFNQVIKQTSSNSLKAKAFHNLGVSLQDEKKYDEAIKAYKNSLRIQPNNAESKYNLEVCQRQLQQQNQNKQQNQQNSSKEQEEKKRQAEQLLKLSQIEENQILKRMNNFQKRKPSSRKNW